MLSKVALKKRSNLLLPLQELCSDSQKFSQPRSKDRHVIALRHNPQLRAWNSLIHLDRNAHRKEDVAVTVDDQGPRLDGAQVGRRKVHVLIAVLESRKLRRELTQLIAAALRAFLLLLANFRRSLVSTGSHYS